MNAAIPDYELFDNSEKLFFQKIVVVCCHNQARSILASAVIPVFFPS
jgi:hypothetical protein